MNTTTTIRDPEKYRRALRASGKAWQKRVRILSEAEARSRRAERKEQRAIRQSTKHWLPVSWQAQRQYDKI